MKLYHGSNVINIFWNRTCYILSSEAMTDIDYMIEHVAADLIVLLIEKRGLTFTEAVDTLYTSDTYTKLCNKDTGKSQVCVFVFGT